VEKWVSSGGTAGWRGIFKSKTNTKINPNTEINTNTKINGDGQECPSHTGGRRSFFLALFTNC
jgi:hypothetical protein